MTMRRSNYRPTGRLTQTPLQRFLTAVIVAELAAIITVAVSTVVRYG